MIKHTKKDGLVMTLLHRFLGDVEIFNGDMRVIKGNTNVTLISSNFYNMMDDVYSEIIDIMNDELYDNEDYSGTYTDYDGLLNATSRYCSFKNPTTAERKRKQLEWSLVVRMIDTLVSYELSLREDS